jgi:hypothetical protein
MMNTFRKRERSLLPRLKRNPLPRLKRSPLVKPSPRRRRRRPKRSLLVSK